MTKKKEKDVSRNLNGLAPQELLKRNVKVIVAKRGTTLKAECIRAGVSYQLVHMWVSNDLRLSSLFNLANVLGVDVAELVRDDEGILDHSLTCPRRAIPPEEKVTNVEGP